MGGKDGNPGSVDMSWPEFLLWFITFAGACALFWSPLFLLVYFINGRL